MKEHKHIAILSTGGTIEKTYNESDGTMANQRSVLEIMLASLVLHGVQVDRIPVMNVDSVHMTDSDHERIVKVAAAYCESHDGLIITHGTDQLPKTGELMVERLGITPPVPIILTGAMRPYALRNTDAVQNLTEALLAVQLLPSGVYVVLHNIALRFPGVVKDHRKMTFRRAAETEP